VYAVAVASTACQARSVSRAAREAVTVLAVDDYAPYRIVEAEVVSATPGFELVGEAASGQDALDAVVRLRPDLVLLDVNMPGVDGIQTSRRLAGASHPTVVVLVSADDTAVSASDLSSCGAAAFLPKSHFSPSTLRAVWARHGA
jgi:DNA-binding NarL/FixJ family response regulator